ncbi:hypothetical protein ACFQ1Q_01025 [Winogradskyella litorisediminis]|uniref:LTXXQ motif family protein n=1 Tax=Winogradskyella litorisediminis TaxID=1156618 RepID=A0ABW3N269_9FLAO
MKTFLTTLITVFLVATGYAQDPLLQKDNDKLEKIAMELTRAYDDELNLDGKQFTLFQKKAEEFLIREEKIHRNFSGKEKLDLINELRKAETLEMRNVLTQIQYDRYRKIKPRLQPLGIVEPKQKK